jgi:ABC-type uncharacterized transport system permease subunit
MLISLFTAVLYLLSGLGLVSKLRNPTSFAASLPRSVLLGPVVLALLIHGWLLYQGMFSPAGLNVGLFAVLSLVGWLVSLLLVVVSLSQPVEMLGAIVFPFTAFTVLLLAYNPVGHYLTLQLDAGLKLHILLSILAYSLLSIAAVQAALLYIQDHHLHNKHPGGFIRALPPLETMETLLFRMIGLGFVTLSLSLISGAFYLDDIFGQHLAHKTVLSVLAWLIFAILLWGRWQFGWRGRTAIRWTITGFVILMLAYFGSKFVIQLILQR